MGEGAWGAEGRKRERTETEVDRKMQQQVLGRKKVK